jgi:hypothetical protein
MKEGGNVMKGINVLPLFLLTMFTVFTFGCGGYGSGNNGGGTMTVTPNITALVPTSATAGTSGFTLTVNGSNFATAATVNFNGAAEVTTYVSANQLTAAIPASAIAGSGTKPVHVTNPGSGGIYGTMSTDSNTMNFTVN